MRRSSYVFAGFGVLTLLLAVELYYPVFARPHRDGRLLEERTLVARLGLTDPALFTEARYTRNPSLADLNTPFQDHPGSFDHFPSGTFVPPPATPGKGWLLFQPEAAK
ncbi:hypothetical protein BMI86_00790 [Thioclava sp. DLFJ5-1]|uniref:hypothetical protein n=1 Tax=Thioclava sp. DLFJ5-1 TaxID=1915314 RepID=UPI00099686B6|nr:hypothetical protein [Thioclava sp. DLFJ5-1]OOY21153.1 hypothetical protein BMI86_00790 [Thioclava sp. DLFJ5-1]